MFSLATPETFRDDMKAGMAPAQPVRDHLMHEVLYASLQSAGRLPAGRLAEVFRATPWSPFLPADADPVDHHRKVVETTHQLVVGQLEDHPGPARRDLLEGRHALESFGRGPRLDPRASPVRADQPDRHAELLLQIASEVVADGGEVGDRLGRSFEEQVAP